MSRAVFLDRDGVINRALVRNGRPFPPSGLHELEILPGVPDAMTRLRQAGFQLIVVTNQPDVARGKTSRETVKAINAKLQSMLPVDEIRECYHDDADDCPCRKPKPGLLLEAARLRGLNLSRSFMVGDRWRDVEAGQRAGCTTLFIDYGYDEANHSKPHVRVSSLVEAVEWILDTMRDDGK